MVGPVQRVGPICAVVSSPALAVETVGTLTSSSHGKHVHFVNAYTIALADKDPDYRQVISGTAINFPDGRPLAWVSRIRRHSPPLCQVRGPQFFLNMFDVGREKGLRHYLLGSTDEVLQQLTKELRRRFPGVQIVGSHSPPFRAATDVELSDQDEAIRCSMADIVWVGLGTPKQDYEARRLSASLPIVAVAIGAAFDFTAGSSKEAPAWLSKIGLEWLFRLASEPRRLWRRYLFGNARFIAAAMLPTSSKVREGLGIMLDEDEDTPDAESD